MQENNGEESVMQENREVVLTDVTNEPQCAKQSRGETHEKEEEEEEEEEEDGVSAYSALNPGKRRFDLLRVPVALHHPSFSSSSFSSSCFPFQFEGSYSDMDSFFVDHEWNYCFCAVCHSFLGWGFRRKKKTEGEKPKTEVEHDVASSKEADDIDETLEETLTRDSRTPSSNESGNPSSRRRLSSNANAAFEAQTVMSSQSSSSSSSLDQRTASRTRPDFVGLVILKCRRGEGEWNASSLVQLAREESERKLILHSLFSIEKDFLFLLNELSSTEMLFTLSAKLAKMKSDLFLQLRSSAFVEVRQVPKIPNTDTHTTKKKIDGEEGVPESDPQRGRAAVAHAEAGPTVGVEGATSATRALTDLSNLPSPSSPFPTEEVPHKRIRLSPPTSSSLPLVEHNKQTAMTTIRLAAASTTLTFSDPHGSWAANLRHLPSCFSAFLVMLRVVLPTLA